MPAATATLLEDAAVNIDQWLAAEVEQAFAEQEGAAFVTGDGSNKPKGFLSYTTVANASWVWGNIGYIATGAAGAFAGDEPVRRAGRPRSTRSRPATGRTAVFVMNRKTQAAIRKFKDAGGNYLWQPPAQAGGRASADDASRWSRPRTCRTSRRTRSRSRSAISRRGYLVVDRAGVRVLRDPFTAKPYVLFYTTKRVGGGVQDFDAIKLLKFAAS